MRGLQALVAADLSSVTGPPVRVRNERCLSHTGCCNKAPPPAWLQRHRFIVSQLWRLEASIKVAAGPVWGEAAVLCFWTVASRCPGLSACECVVAEQALVSVSSHEDSGPVGPRLPLMTSNLDYFRTDAVPKYSGTGGGVRPSAYEVGLARWGGRCSPHPT